jgi:ABC-type uncharacterized transport system involved in gliding motility auxiliary subunit
MAQQNPNPTSPMDDEPFIPPYYMLILAFIGLVVALVVAVTQPTFSVVGWGGLGIALLALVAWILMAPQQARGFLTGRTVRFGGVSIIVTVIVLVALIAIYTFIRGQNIRLDLTQRDTFSLTEESRTAIDGIGKDPNLPQVNILAFYDAGQAGRRDQDALLLEDYKTTSAGKITYEFVDPDRNPALAEQYSITSPGQISVVALGPDGQPDIENAQKITFLSQDQMTNAILRVAASGDFRAYFLNVEDGIELTVTGPAGMSTLNDSLKNSFDWKTQQVSIFQISAAESEITLNDPAADGEVMLIPGGSKPLTDDELKIVTDYVDQGGNLIIFAAPSINADNTSLSTGEKLSEYLYTNFGVRFVENMVLDRTLSFQSPIVPVSVDFSRNNYITQGFPTGNGMVFELPRSIEVAPTLPQNVTVDELARTSAEAYAKTDVQAVIDGNIDPTDTDAKGPFVLAAAAENAVTGSRVVLFGSTSIPLNNYAQLNNAVNLDAAFNSMVWTTHFNDFFATVTIQSEQRPQDTPIFVDQQTGSTINLVTIFLLPFGVLLIGFLVWWNSREPAR